MITTSGRKSPTDAIARSPSLMTSMIWIWLWAIMSELMCEATCGTSSISRSRIRSPATVCVIASLVFDDAPLRPVPDPPAAGAVDRAALLADHVAVLDKGGVAQRGTPAELADSPASAFVADLTGAVVLRGEARSEGELTVIALDGGGEITSTEEARGRVAASVYPWEIGVEPPDVEVDRSAMNRLEADVVAVTDETPRARTLRLALSHPVPHLAGQH